MLSCLFCSKIGGGTLLSFKRHLAPCVAVPKSPWDKDSNTAESSEMIQTVLHRVGHRGRSHPCFRGMFPLFIISASIYLNELQSIQEGPWGRSSSSGGTEPALLAGCCPQGLGNHSSL